MKIDRQFQLHPKLRVGDEARPRLIGVTSRWLAMMSCGKALLMSYPTTKKQAGFFKPACAILVFPE
jgi:TfoX/Sxy family transcriptional regulator of competence genes